MIYNDIYFNVGHMNLVKGDIYCNNLHEIEPFFWLNIGYKFLPVEFKVVNSNKLNKKLYPNFLKEHEGKLVMR